MEENEKKIKIVEATIPLKRVYPEDLQTNFVVNMTIQHESDHFILQFFEVFPPLLLGSNEEKKAVIESLDHVDAKCVSRIVVTPEKFGEFLKTMNENYHNFLSKFDNNKDENVTS
jgi:hypothetical protein